MAELYSFYKNRVSFNPSQKSPGFNPRDECTLFSAREGASTFRPRGSTRIKYAVVMAIVISAFFLHLQDCIADSVSIKGTMKVHRMGGYVILINYETHDKWTDGLLFKVHCKFDEAESTFTSGSMNNVESGWHKIQIAISDVMTKRHGSLREYEIELYRNGILVDKKKSY